MLFNSYIFILAFLPVVVAGFYALARIPALARTWLLAASYVFYAWWNPIYLPLLLGSTAVNYAFGRALRSRPRRSLLTFGVAFNIGLLGLFKYTDFGIATINDLFMTNLRLLEIALPLAISFFTFQQVAFLVDAHRQRLEIAGPLEYALFVAFFPQLIAGPIVQYKWVADQFRDLGRRFDRLQFAQGVTLFSIGLFKKVVIADNLAPLANGVFDAALDPVVLSSLDAWGGTLAFTLQLYYDFSGYSDMALGLGHLFGIRLPLNFDVPYRSTTIAEFWRRWHITLGQFLRDYLYIPLGGNRKGAGRTYTNLLLTFTLGGLWHGAGWTFLLWGIAHGLFLVIQRAWSSDVPKILAWALTFVSVSMAWVLFRSESLDAAGRIIRDMLAFDFTRSTFGIGQAAVMLSLLALNLALPSPVPFVRQERSRSWRPAIAYAVASALLFVAAFSSLLSVSEFLYFDF